jgi:hypothetical protein
MQWSSLFAYAETSLAVHFAKKFEVVGFVFRGAEVEKSEFLSPASSYPFEMRLTVVISH